MTPHILAPWWTLGVAAWSAAVGCSAIPGPAPIGPVGPTQAALAMAMALERAGDSAVAVDGDSGAANRYYGAASVLRRHPAFDTVMIVVDGSPANYDAVALAVADSMGPGACQVGRMAQAPAARSECRRGSPRPTYTLFAWRAARERQIVQLVVPSGADGAGGLPVRRQAASDSMSSDRTWTAHQGLPARLTYTIGRGGARWGPVSSQQSAVMMVGPACAMPHEVPQAAGVANVEAAGDGLHIRNVACQQAGFFFAFVGTIIAPADAWGAETASTTHVLWMALSRVPGAYLTLGALGAGH